MSLSASAKTLFDHLPKDGSKVGGITVKKDLGWRDPAFKEAKRELQEEGLVVLGRGRGGSIARVEGKELEREVTKQERMAMAREAKQANSRAKRDRDVLMRQILDYVHKAGHPQVSAKDVSFSDGRPVIAIWSADGKNAQMYGVPRLEYDKLRAIGG